MTHIKSNQKLHDGSYFVIRVGPKFYGGSYKEVVDKEPSNRWEWGRPDYRFSTNLVHPRSNKPRDQRDLRKKSLAKYRKPAPEKVKMPDRVLSGKTLVRLVDDIDQAKKIRRKAQAENACEELKRMYQSLGVKITIEFKKGESNERS